MHKDLRIVTYISLRVFLHLHFECFFQPVTPYQSRKRVLSSGSALDTNNPRMAALKVAGSREGRSLSYSPGLDVTASLPVGRLTVSETCKELYTKLNVIIRCVMFYWSILSFTGHCLGFSGSLDSH